MRDFRLRSDLKRAVINGFAFPLGIEPGRIAAPNQGYTITYTPGEGEEPDTYAFHIVVSHEKLAPILDRTFELLLPDEVFGIVEIGSRDAYRSVDVFIGEEPIDRDEFIQTWKRYEPLLLEEGSIAAGANSEDPFVEVFVDQSKGLFIHVPLAMRDEVESMLHGFGLEEVAQTWIDPEDDGDDRISQVRQVLDLEGDALDIDELLMQLRHDWRLELNIDPETNIDEGGRELGLTLWQAIVIVEDADAPTRRADMVVWATAGSLNDIEELITDSLRQYPEWSFVEVYTIDRVAYDERPEQLAELSPRRHEAAVHLVQIIPWPSEPRDGVVS